MFTVLLIAYYIILIRNIIMIIFYLTIIYFYKSERYKCEILDLWPPDWWIPLSSVWYNGFQNHVTLDSLTPSERNISDILQTIWIKQNKVNIRVN